MIREDDTLQPVYSMGLGYFECCVLVGTEALYHGVFLVGSDSNLQLEIEASVNVLFLQSMLYFSVTVH